MLNLQYRILFEGVSSFLYLFEVFARNFNFQAFFLIQTENYWQIFMAQMKVLIINVGPTQKL